MSLSEDRGNLTGLARLDMEGLNEERDNKGKQRMDEYPTTCLSPGILRRPSINSTYSDQDRLSIGSSTGDTLSITLSRRSSRVRFSDIEPSPTNPTSTAMLRRGSAEAPSRSEVNLGRIRPASLPVPPSTTCSGNTDFAPKLLPTPQHSPTRPTRSPSLRPKSSIDGLRADLDTHRLSANILSRRNSRSSVAGPSRRNSSRFSILVEPEDLALLAESEARIEAAFAPLPLRYPTQSRPNSMFISSDNTAATSSSRPLSLPLRPSSSNTSSPRSVSLPLPLPLSIPLPPLPSLVPHSISESTPSRALSPILDDDDVDTPTSAALQSGTTPVDHRESDPYHDFMSGALLSPTGRKREKTDQSILSLSGVALFPVPPPRVVSSDRVNSIEQASTFDDSATLPDEDLEGPESLAKQVEPTSEGVEWGEMTDDEAIVNEACLGSSPALSDMIEQMEARRELDDGAESEIDLHMPITEAAIASGIISARSRLLRPKRAVSSLGIPRPAASAHPAIGLTRSTSFTGSIYPSSDSEDEEFTRTVRAVTMRKLAKSMYLRRKQEEEAERARIRSELDLDVQTPNKRFSTISSSSCSSSDLLTPDTRRHTFDINYRSPLAIARELQSPSKASGSGTKVPASKRYSVPAKPGRSLPHPRRQIKGWGPPEIMIYEESDDEPIALSSSDEESCLPTRTKDESFRMNVHYDSDKAKKRLSFAGSQSGQSNDWLMDEELPQGGEISDFEDGDRLCVPGSSIIGRSKGAPF